MNRARLLVWMVLSGAGFFERESAGATMIKDPHPPKYGLEIEPHLSANFHAANDWGYNGIGVGARFSIPLAGPAFISKINDSVAISFGGDLFRSYANIKRGDGATVTYWSLFLPVALQWNFWLTDKWSAFAEPGVVVRWAFGGCTPADGCKNPAWLGGAPAFPGLAVGARYHFSGGTPALTFRVGFPTGLAVGVSFF